VTTDLRGAAPSDALLEAVHSALAAGNVDRAISLAELGLSEGKISSLLLNLAAHRCEVEGRYDDALGLLNRALLVSPGNHFILNSLGGVLTKAGRPRDALAMFEAALRDEPNFAPAHHGRGVALSTLGNPIDAWSAHAQANALAPNYPDPIGALAALATEGGDYAVARSLAEQALMLEPGQAPATLSLARIALHEQDFEGVIKLIDGLHAAGGLTTLHTAAAERLRADALDASKRYDEAMDAYMAANRALRSVYMNGVENAGIELGVELCARLHEFFQSAPPVWREAPHTPPVPHRGVIEHVFLLGFPRSGTTLLEQVLATHPDISALEERPTLDPILDKYFGDASALLRLANLDGDDITREREDYWMRVETFDVDTTRRVFVDKLPLNTIYIPLIAKMFPKAKIILALRDPRDVVVSCFRRRFRANTLVVEYTDLARTAQFYDGAMRLAELYRENLDLPVYVHSHEALVDDFEAETRAICGFLNVPWSEDLKDFAKTARERNIQTPSVNQVRRGLYREGMAQWRRYQAHLPEVLPILEPWVERYGYPPTRVKSALEGAP